MKEEHIWGERGGGSRERTRRGGQGETVVRM